VAPFPQVSNKALYAPPLSPIRATCPAHSIRLDFIILIIFSEATDHKAPRYVVFSTSPSPRAVKTYDSNKKT
jgi:hypothetical protein